MNNIAIRSTWQNIPIDNPTRIDIDFHFTEKQFAKIIRGLIPEQMEDKWFIFYENEWLYFHRSWTGNGMYKAKIIKEENSYYIKEFWAERNKEKYKNEDDNEDKQTISLLIARGLLGIDVSKIYAVENIISENDAIKGWSNFGNMLFANQGIDPTDNIKSILFGLAVGDALGVPVEFKSRQEIALNPVTGIIGYGTYNLPAGTFSDDSSLAFCLAEALTQEFNLQNIANNFIAWLNDNYWTPRGKVFDVGNATRQAITRLQEGCKPELAGGMKVSDNGNGSLMRILPLIIYIKDKPLADRYQITKQVSSITHGHILSVIACFYYLEFARQIINGMDRFQIYKNLQTEILEHLNALSINPNETQLFDRLLKGNIYDLTEKEIFSTGYVLHTLEASIWCLLTTDNYKSAVLKAVNLGEDTDTTGAVTGGLAGLLYGFETIPESWLQQIARKDDIDDLADRLQAFASR